MAYSGARPLAAIVREAIYHGATLAEIRETAISEALLHYCNVTRAARALGWQRPAVAKRMKAMGLTVSEMRKLKSAQRSLPLKKHSEAPKLRTKTATSGL